MAKGTRGRRRIASRQCKASPYPMPSYIQTEVIHQKNCLKIDSKDWKDAKCSVCMERPHNAVLLLCSSHDKGCHPYMCGTSFRYSNCLDQYKKAYLKAASSDDSPIQESLHDLVMGGLSAVGPIKNLNTVELACPLCRGQVKGWTVVEPAREYFNAKKRNCMQDNCKFMGTYKQLRKHMRVDHPSAKPRELDPSLEKKWNGMEREREREDVISTIRSSMPGAVFFGDYVIEGNHYGSDSDTEGLDADSMEQNDRNFMSLFLFLQAFGSAGNTGPNRDTRQDASDSIHTIDRGLRRLNEQHSVGFFDSSFQGGQDNSNDDLQFDILLTDRLHHRGGALLARSERRRRRRESNNNHP